MRIPALVLAFALAAPAAVFAAPVSEVHVTIGPKLESKAHDYGQKDIDFLTKDLKEHIESVLRARHQLGGGGRLEVVIEDATPNRPTFAQLGRNPSLSMRSVGIGGATIRGHLGGTEVNYSFWEDDIRNERGAATWSDAERAFDGFAHRVADAH
ncbi:MAG TPA: hypothetical protein VG407_02775 [Caulobacteraceae bacterium]|jgi:hypothetical protein|nr:hypothetical protein [Caulobacteraceae bacterium]